MHELFDAAFIFLTNCQQLGKLTQMAWQTNWVKTALGWCTDHVQLFRPVQEYSEQIPSRSGV